MVGGSITVLASIVGQPSATTWYFNAQPLYTFLYKGNNSTGIALSRNDRITFKQSGNPGDYIEEMKIDNAVFSDAGTYSLQVIFLKGGFTQRLINYELVVTGKIELVTNSFFL